MNLKAGWIVGVLVASAFRVVGLWPDSPEMMPLVPLTLPEEKFVSAIQQADTQILLNRADGSFQKLTASSFQLAAWDPKAAVYVSAGPDGQPGVAGVDDEGNGVVDDRSELGATGSDDPMLTPDHPDYALAASPDAVAQVLSRGAMRPVAQSQTIRGPAHVRIDAHQEQRLVSKIIDLVPDRSGQRP